MIKTQIIVLYLSYLFFYNLYGQQLTNKSVNSDKQLYWIFFTDKGDSLCRLSPKEFLSERSLQRRITQQIPIDYHDYPVNPEYLHTLIASHITLRYPSKWLNAVSAWMNAADINAVKQFRFVKAILPVQKLVTCAQKPVDVEKIIPEKNYIIDELDYGKSFEQLNQVKANELHRMGLTGKGILVSIMDDGFNKVNSREGFEQLFAENRIKGWYDFVENDTTVFDVGGHGTMCFSIMAAYLKGHVIGSGYGAEFILLRTEDAKTETIVEEDNWVRGAEYADSLGANIFQTSLGYTRFDDHIGDHTYNDMNGNTTVITKAADLAAGRGILVINAAGNEGSSAWKYIGAPADGDSVLAIGAVDEKGVRAMFSSLGPRPDGRIKPDVMAMGEGTAHLKDWGYAIRGNGTSFAAPVISGWAACLMQSKPDVKSMDLYKMILASGNRAKKPDNEYGYGIPDGIKVFEMLHNLKPIVPKKKQKLQLTLSGQTLTIKGLKKNKEYILLYEDIIYGQKGNEKIISTSSEPLKVVLTKANKNAPFIIAEIALSKKTTKPLFRNRVLQPTAKKS